MKARRRRPGRCRLSLIKEREGGDGEAGCDLQDTQRPGGIRPVLFRNARALGEEDPRAAEIRGEPRRRHVAARAIRGPPRGDAEFDSSAALQAGLGSAEGAATAADLENFADGGVDLYFFDDREV
jgi:hypothetical protein